MSSDEKSNQQQLRVAAGSKVIEDAIKSREESLAYRRVIGSQVRSVVNQRLQAIDEAVADLRTVVPALIDHFVGQPDEYEAVCKDASVELVGVFEDGDANGVS